VVGSTAGAAFVRTAGVWTLPSGGADVTTTGVDNALTLLFAQIQGSGQIRKKGTGGLYIPYTGAGTEIDINTSWTGGIDVQEGALGTAFGDSSVPTSINRLFGTGTVTFAANTKFFNGSGSVGFRILNNVVINGNWESAFNATTSTGQLIVLAGPVTLNNNPTLTQTSSGAGTDGGTSMIGVLSGTTGFVKAGNRSLYINNAGNTISGTVRVGGPAPLIALNALSLQNVTFDPSGAGALSLPVSATLGGLTGSGSFNGAGATTMLTLGGGTIDVSATTTAALTGTFNITKARAGTQQFSGNSTRAAGNTTISAGAIQLNTANGLYANGASGITTVSSGAGLWLSGGFSLPNTPLRINGTGVNSDGAIRNVSGNNLVNGSFTLETSSTVQNDVSGTTLTLFAGAVLGSTSNRLTLSVGSGATIALNQAITGTGLTSILIPSSNLGTVSAASASTSVLAASFAQIDGTFSIGPTNQSIGTGKKLQGVGSITTSGNGKITMNAGSTLQAGNSLGGATLTIGALTFGSGTPNATMVVNKDSSGDPSKVSVTGDLVLNGNVTVNVSAPSGTWVSNTPYTFLTYGGTKTGSGTFVSGTVSGGVGRQTGMTFNTTSSPLTFTVVDANATVTWNSGSSTNTWYDQQPTGWTATGNITDFRNGDTVIFDATSFVTATLAGSVTVASLTMSGASHTIDGGSYSLTNNGALSTSGAFTQTLNVAGNHGAVNVGQFSTLALGHAGALGGSADITLTGTNANLSFGSGATGLSTPRLLKLSPGSTVSQYLETSGNSIVTISGAVSGGSAGAHIRKVGAGVVSLTGSLTAVTSNICVGELNNNAGEGRNVLRVGNSFPSTGTLRLNSASILEITATQFTKAYGNTAGNVYLEDTSTLGAGFSSFNTSGTAVTTSITFGSGGPTSQWNGPMYFGTALGTSTGKLTMSGTLGLASTQTTQTFHVFNGANAAGSSAQINLLRSIAVVGTKTFIKSGPGSLYVVNGGNGTGPTNAATMRVKDGAFEMGPTTLNAIQYIEIPSDAVSPVVRKESSTLATACLPFSPNPLANFTVEAVGTGVFTLGVLDIGSQTVTLAGTGTGAKPTTSGNGSGKYIKTGSGTWSLDYGYTNRSDGFSGGIDVQEGNLKSTKKNSFGNGTVKVTNYAQIQFTDTVTDPTTIGSIKKLETTGSGARLVIGA
jgi:hypothetical protein